MRDGEASPAGVDRTKYDESASKGSTLERRLLFSDGIEMASIGGCSERSNRWELEREEQEGGALDFFPSNLVF